MTARIALYAVGAGSGHAVRAAAVQRLVAAEGIGVTTFIRDGVPRSHLCDDEMRPRASRGPCEIKPFSLPALRAEAEKGARLIVDTFPAGWQGELSRDVLALFPKRIFIARYRRRLDWSVLRAEYSSVVAPYSRLHCEWDELPSGVERIGFLLLPRIGRWISGGSDLAVLDPEGRLSDAARDTIRRSATSTGRHTRFFTAFPERCVAEKFLFIGAGYNCVHELMQEPVDARFVPVEKRHDDQHRRARLWGRGVGDPLELRHWLAATMPKHSAKLLPEELCRSAEWLQ